MQRRMVSALGCALAASVALVGAPSGGAAAAASYTVTSLHFAVTTGPNGTQPCDIVGDLYKPSTASTSHRAPAILTTNGFGGSAADQAPFAQRYAALGYVVLSYSGLGFGGSGCKITLDDPDYDGRAGSQLVSFLGGAPGIGFTDAAHTTAASPVDYVVHDARSQRQGADL